jgi:hypothetical protein
MTETDWAPFKNLAPDPWPKVRSLVIGDAPPKPSDGTPAAARR